MRDTEDYLQRIRRYAERIRGSLDRLEGELTRQFDRLRQRNRISVLGSEQASLAMELRAAGFWGSIYAIDADSRLTLTKAGVEYRNDLAEDKAVSASIGMRAGERFLRALRRKESLAKNEHELRREIRDTRDKLRRIRRTVDRTRESVDRMEDSMARNFRRLRRHGKIAVSGLKQAEQALVLVKRGFGGEIYVTDPDSQRILRGAGVEYLTSFKRS